MANPLWSGRFNDKESELMQDINASIGFDKRLYVHDILGSIEHCKMLSHCNIISADESAEIINGLEKIKVAMDSGDFTFSVALEDIHMHVEHALGQYVGSVAGKLHTARSRNDQVATSSKMWVRDASGQLDALLSELQHVILRLAKQHVDTIMPGFTHMQVAQPVVFGHHLMAYFEMFSRDRCRLSDNLKRLNECPLGAAALAGTAFPINRMVTAKNLHFDQPMRNSLDAVSDRDFILDLLYASSVCVMHLSRLAEELVMWCSSGFNFVKLPEGMTTGSSIMPQKRNPDAAELIRAKTGRIYGALHTLLVVMKGLPLAYSKDMQEDKESVFDAVDNLTLCISAMTKMLEGITVNRDAMLRMATTGFSTATDLADMLVMQLNIPFRDAHHIVGRIVKLAEERQCMLHQLSLDEVHKIDCRISAEMLKSLSVQNSVASRKSFGGTAPANVLEAISKAEATHDF